MANTSGNIDGSPHQPTNGINSKFPSPPKKPSSKRPPGSRSKWSQCSTPEKFCWLAAIPFRTLLCLVNIFCFVFAYFGFMLPVLWARKLWPRFYWGYEGKLYMWLQAFVAYWGYTAGFFLIFWYLWVILNRVFADMFMLAHNGPQGGEGP